jgi:hypothetical protein
LGKLCNAAHTLSIRILIEISIACPAYPKMYF